MAPACQHAGLVQVSISLGNSDLKLGTGVLRALPAGMSTSLPGSRTKKEQRWQMRQKQDLLLSTASTRQ